MLSLSAIRQVSRDAAVIASRQNKIPFTVEPQDLADWKARFKAGILKFPFPFLGNYVPQGWKRTDRPPLFVDSTGRGRDDEPALSVNATIEALIPGRAYAIIESSQFQLYLAEYQRDDSFPGNESEFVGMTSAEEAEFEREFGEQAKADIEIRFEGTICLFEPLSRRGAHWLNSHVAEPTYFGNALVVENRFAKELAHAMKSDGLLMK